MAQDKYRLEKYLGGNYLFKDQLLVAKFYDKAVSQKVCDLLNEASCSQGKYPKQEGGKTA